MTIPERHQAGQNGSPSALSPVYFRVTKLVCSLAGRTLTLRLDEKSWAAAIYGRTEVQEEYYCNFGVNPDYVPIFQSSQLKISGRDAEGEMRIVELANHPFFLATLFVPQLRSTAQNPHPLVTEFVKCAVGRR